MTDPDARNEAAPAKPEGEGALAGENLRIPPFSTQLTNDELLRSEIARLQASCTSSGAWQQAVTDWLWEQWSEPYRTAYPDSELLTVTERNFVYLFDAAAGRQIGACAVISGPGGHTGRDRSRMRGFPGHSDHAYQKGHLLAHAMGGGTDINLFHQLGVFNNGKFRELENRALKRAGSLYFVHLAYANSAWEKPLSAFSASCRWTRAAWTAPRKAKPASSAGSLVPSIRRHPWRWSRVWFRRRGKGQPSRGSS